MGEAARPSHHRCKGVMKRETVIPWAGKRTLAGGEGEGGFLLARSLTNSQILYKTWLIGGMQAQYCKETIFLNP